MPGVSIDSFIHLLTTTVYAVLTDWCLGDIADEDLVDRISEAFLVILVGMTKGQINVDAKRWLQDLRGKRPSWTAMRRLAEVPLVPGVEWEPGWDASDGGDSATTPPRAKSRRKPAPEPDAA